MTSALAFVRVLIFDHLDDAPLIIGDHAAIVTWIVRLEPQDDDLGFVIRMKPVEHGLHRFAPYERHIAIEHKYIARMPFQQLLSLLHGVPGSQLRFLQACFGIAAQRLFNLLAPCPDDDDLLGRRERIDTAHKVFQHGSARNRVENLVQVAFHAGALARSKDNGGEFVGVAHGKCPCHQMLAV